jgi:hypothetical protein
MKGGMKMTVTRTMCFPTLSTSYAKTDVLSASNVAKFTLVGATDPDNPNIMQSRFVLQNGYANEKAYATLRREYQPKNDFTRNSLRLESKVKITSSLDDSVKYDRLEAQIGWNYSGNNAVDPSEIMQLIYAAFGLVVHLDEAAGPDEDVVNAFEFGIVNSVA